MMQRVLACLVVLAWGLWFGGLLTLFIAVQSLFTTFAADRTTAGIAASGIFRRFEIYQIALAAAAVLATFAWRILSGPSSLKSALIGFFIVTTALAISLMTMITPMIEALRAKGETSDSRFGMLHGIAMTLYAGEAILLLIAGLILPTAISRDRVLKTRAVESSTEPRITSAEVG